MSNISKEAIAETLELAKRAAPRDWRLVTPACENNDIKPKGYYVVEAFGGCVVRPHPESPQWSIQSYVMPFIANAPKAAQQVRELDALVDWVLVVAEEIANTKIADISEIERLNYSIRDKIKEARGE
jgi:hypothetical protein